MNKCRGFEGSPPRLLDSEEHIFRLTYNTEDDCETDISMELIVAEIVMFHFYDQILENLNLLSSFCHKISKNLSLKGKDKDDIHLNEGIMQNASGRSFNSIVLINSSLTDRRAELNISAIDAKYIILAFS